jgi:PAS domain S-box-containing protein
MPMSAFEPLFDLSQDLLGILDLDGQFVRVSTSFQRDLGWSGDALAGRAFFSPLHDTMPPQRQRIFTTSPLAARPVSSRL